MPTTSKITKTTKSDTAKKPAAKKPAAKKTAAKKPAAKKPAVKKAAVKKPAAKPAAKKPAAKKTAVKKAAVKKPAAKPAAKKPAAKPAAKPAVIKPAAKPVEKKAAVKPAAKPAKPAEVAAENDVKYRNLFDAFAQGKLPFSHGYIVSSFFSENSAYSIYEIVSYSGVKEIFVTETGLQFITGGKKLYVLVEQDTYPLKYQEPVSRRDGERIPKRFSELEIIKARNQYQVMVAKEPNETYGSFTVLKPMGQNFAVVLYQLPDVYQTLTTFFEESLNKQRKVPQSDAKTAAALIATKVEKFMGFKGEFEQS